MDEGWSVQYTQGAIDFILENVHSKQVASKIFECRRMLQDFSDFGKIYDPEYPAAMLPFPCRYIAIPDTSFNLYYIKEVDAMRIVIFCIDYQRIDPNARFSNINWAISDW